MNKKRKMELFETLYRHIKVKNLQEQDKENRQGLTFSEDTEDSSFKTQSKSVSKPQIPKEIIRSSLSTFGQTVNGSYSFLSCDLSSKGLVSLNGIQSYDKLEHLNCSKNDLSEVEELAALANLFFLDLSRNKIQRLSLTHFSSKLVTLDLSHNKLKKLPQLSRLPFLKKFRASHNCLTSFGELSHQQLEDLDLSHNSVSIIEGPLDFPMLELLDFSFNELFDISPFQNLANLQILRLNKNSIRSLNALQFLETLIELELACNEIASFDEINLLSSLPYLSALDLSMNICQSLKFYRFQVIYMLPGLTVLDGQPVDPKEQVKADCFFGEFIDLENRIFSEQLPEEKFIDKRVFMSGLVMKIHMSPRIDLSIKNVFGSTQSVSESNTQPDAQRPLPLSPSGNRLINTN